MSASVSQQKRTAAVKIVRTLRQKGQVAYLAGGCVRDEILGIEPKDFDVATSADPQAVKRLFKSSRLVGEAFGVVLVRMNGHWIEVATFREEWGYEDGRRPSEVKFSDAPHDARRRDFTINGLFQDPFASEASTETQTRAVGQVIDFVGGLKDLKAGIVRAIGEPRERFAEDYLRLLRAVRFAARLDFRIEPGTARAIRAKASSLARISRERIGQEILLMLGAADPSGRIRAAHLIQNLHLDGPSLNEDHLRPRRCRILETLSAEAHFPTVLAAWMLDRHLEPGSIDQAKVVNFVREDRSAIVRRWRKALCLSNDHRDALNGTFGVVPKALDWPALPLARKKKLMTSPQWHQGIDLAGALESRFGARAKAALRKTMNQIEGEAPGLIRAGINPQPLIDGADLMRIGLKPGPQFGRLLKKAYEAQLNGALKTPNDALAWVRRQIDKNPMNRETEGAP